MEQILRVVGKPGAAVIITAEDLSGQLGVKEAEIEGVVAVAQALDRGAVRGAELEYTAIENFAGCEPILCPGVFAVKRSPGKSQTAEIHVAVVLKVLVAVPGPLAGDPLVLHLCFIAQPGRHQ